MIFQIDPLSAKPVYQQLIDQVKYALATGRLAEGDRLEPIREVAIRARVNRNTIARAYLELEREGIIRTRAGQGSFVCGGTALAKAKARKLLAEQIDDLLARAHQFKLSEADVLELVRERLERVQLTQRQEKPNADKELT